MPRSLTCCEKGGIEAGFRPVAAHVRAVWCNDAAALPEESELRMTRMLGEAESKYELTRT